jgi:hypothetical protein
MIRLIRHGTATIGLFVFCRLSMIRLHCGYEAPRQWSTLSANEPVFDFACGGNRRSMTQEAILQSSKNFVCITPQSWRVSVVDQYPGCCMGCVGNAPCDPGSRGKAAIGLSKMVARVSVSEMLP